MASRYAGYLAGATLARTGDELSGPALLLLGPDRRSARRLGAARGPDRGRRGGWARLRRLPGPQPGAGTAARARPRRVRRRDRPGRGHLRAPAARCGRRARGGHRPAQPGRRGRLDRSAARGRRTKAPESQPARRADVHRRRPRRSRPGRASRWARRARGGGGPGRRRGAGRVGPARENDPETKTRLKDGFDSSRAQHAAEAGDMRVDALVCRHRHGHRLLPPAGRGPPPRAGRRRAAADRPGGGVPAGQRGVRAAPAAVGPGPHGLAEHARPRGELRPGRAHAQRRRAGRGGRASPGSPKDRSSRRCSRSGTAKRPSTSARRFSRRRRA